MNTSSDAAEQIVRMTLQGMEVALRVSGSGAKNIAAMLVAIAKDQQKVKGKTSLTNMLKSGRPLKVFSIRENDIKKFTEEAKQIIISEFYAIMNEQCYFKKKSMTRERKMYLEMLEVAKKIGRMNEDVLAIV